jgi:putative ABC transport system permease protein
MRLLESHRIALLALRVNAMRSLLTVLGIVVGVAAVVCIVAVGAGAQAQVTEKIRTLGSNLVIVMPGAQNTGGARLEAGTRHTLKEDDARAITREIPGVVVASPVISKPAQVVAGSQNRNTLVAGIAPDYFVAREWRVAAGRPFTGADIEGGAKVAIVGAVLAEHLFGEASPLGQNIRVGSVPFTVVGLLEKKGQAATSRSQDDVVFIPLSTARSRVLGAVRGVSREALDFIVIKAHNAAAIADVTAQAKSLLRGRHQLRRDAPDDFTIENPADVLTAREGAVRSLSYLLIAVASVSLVVGGISIMNIMLVAVTERTREIGIRMAVGARPGEIRQQFLIESVTLSLAGGLLGAVLGCAAAAAIAWQAGWPVLISPWSILFAWGFAGAVGIAFGLYPAQRAARVEPITALRYE